MAEVIGLTVLNNTTYDNDTDQSYGSCDHHWHQFYQSVLSIMRSMQKQTGLMKSFFKMKDTKYILNAGAS